MVIVAGEFVVDPARRDEFLRQREAGMTASRAEAGCLDYVMSADPLVPGRVVLFERWERPEDLDAHLAAQPAGTAGPSAVPVTARQVVRYEVASFAPLG